MSGDTAEPAKAIRVLVADDDPVVLALVEELVAADPALELVGIAVDADAAIQLAADEQPDVAVLDWVMPGGGGSQAAREILNINPNVRIVALTAHDSQEASLDMLRAGAVSFVVKGSPDVLEAIRAATRI
jgi:DNA-binding NarL/FixJ family response regulator